MATSREVLELTAEVTADKEPESAVTLADRRSPELVFAFVGPVGSGVTTTARAMGAILERDYSYEVDYYKVSDIIAEAASLIGEKYDLALKGHDRIDRLQTIGNKLRDAFSTNYLIEKCIEKIAVKRLEQGGYDTSGEFHVPLAKRRAHIIDSLIPIF